MSLDIPATDASREYMKMLMVSSRAEKDKQVVPLLTAICIYLPASVCVSGML
jgi:hypothetical protein